MAITPAFALALPMLVNAGAVVLFDAGEFERAAVLAQQELQTDPGDSAALVLLGRAQLAAGRVLESVRTLHRAAGAQPPSAEANYRLGQALATQASESGTLRRLALAGDIGRAFRRAAELEPRNADYRWALFEYCRHAPAFLGGGRRKAEREAAALAALDPARGHRARAALLLQDERPQAAEAALRQAVAAAPTVADHRYALGYYYQQVQDWSRAFEVFDEIRRRFPAEAQAWYQLGKTAALSGEGLEVGAAGLRRYLQHHRPRAEDPPLSWAHYRLGLVYERLGDTRAAAREFEAALRRQPDLQHAREALAALGR